MQSKCYFQTALGKLVLVCDEQVLIGIDWVNKTNSSNYQQIPENETLLVFNHTKAWLNKYFNHQKPDIQSLSIKLNGTPFQLQVWHELLNIKYGKTKTYKQIAQAVFRNPNPKGCQAIGQAIHHNPIAIIIPCHRVIGSDGKLTGYAGGLKIKAQLLSFEGAEMNLTSIKTNLKN